jgi:predicted ribosome quality control (RQC) complex YloA/Tae2 family protein
VSLRPSELAAVAAELSAHLTGAVVQKVHATLPGRVWLELRVPGRSALLHLCAAPQVGRLSIVDQRPPGTPGEASGFQHLTRTALTGAKLSSVTSDVQRATLTLVKDEKTSELHLELSAPPAVLFTSGGRVLAVTAAAPVPERAGAPFVPRASAASPGTSRLVATGPSSDLPLSRAAESMLATDEAVRAIDSARAPLLSKLGRLQRTRKKVEAEAARTSLAVRYRQDGELLKQHLSEVPRGAKEVSLTEYQADGTIAERTIALEPSRTAQQHAEWLFHQYRRLTRGAELSRKRLAQLDLEKAALDKQLAQLEAAPPALVPVKKRLQEPVARAYREYLGAHGEKIWVGKGGLDNDTLSFKLSRPHFLWLHARGVPGAHVVIPLERGATVPQELLLDAAHLALHHSDQKGEPRGEVSYVPVKHLRKVKGAPGAVTFSQEKTFVLRVEPARLQRLLSSEQ